MLAFVSMHLTHQIQRNFVNVRWRWNGRKTCISMRQKQKLPLSLVSSVPYWLLPVYNNLLIFKCVDIHQPHTLIFSSKLT